MDKAYRIMAIIYELLDEIIGGILTGVYFCTYFLICALVLFGKTVLDSIDCIDSSLLIVIPFLSISYVLGTLFKRGNAELTDAKSVKYIMNKAKYNIENSEYMKTISDQHISDCIREFEYLKGQFHINVSIAYLKKKKRAWQIVERPNHVLFSYILKNTRRAYIFSNLFCVLLIPFIKMFGKGKIYNHYITKREAIREIYIKTKSTIDIKIDYPYTHLKNYLEGNGLSELTKYVNWDSNDGRKTKAFINDILSLLVEKQYLGMKQVKKREAHIRFMNSAYHSQRYLFACSFSVFFSVLLLYVFRFIWLLKMGYIYKNITLANDGYVTLIAHKFFDYVNRTVGFDKLFIVMCISAVYMLFFGITRKLILGNYHFQRIHEIVYLLQAKKHVEDRY